MSRNWIVHRMTTTFSVGAVLFWSNSDLTLGECQHNDGHTPTACNTRHNYDLISVSIPNVHLDQCCLTSAVVYVISGFSGPRIQIIDTMYPCAIGPIGQMVMVHQPLLLNQTVHKFVKVTLFHVTWLLIFGTFSWAEGAMCNLHFFLSKQWRHTIFPDILNFEIFLKSLYWIYRFYLVAEVLVAVVIRNQGDF